MQSSATRLFASPSKSLRALLVVGIALTFLTQIASAQQTLGAITGTVTDPSGAVIADATVKAVNIATNLQVDAHTKANGAFSIPDLPSGTYRVTVTKDGFKTETHTKILVFGNRTTTVDTSLVVGSIGTTVEVNAVPLMNQVDTTIGYVVDANTIETTPLGTGSFTQLAILSPGVHADFLGGGGANTGLGNQAIFANGNRDTSNSFSLNGVSTNNLFNGNSSSQVGENRFVLNTGENFGPGGAIQTSTSVTDAIGQALPTPPADAIQEIGVNSSQYDATQGNNSGAHISVLTKSGTNALHGSLWEQWQNSDMNATPYFYNAAGIARPFLNRNAFGGTIGGPIIKDKLFFFGSYQGVRIADAEASTKDVTVPLSLTDDRSTQGIINMIQTSYGDTLTSSQIDTAASNLLNAKLPNGQYLIPSAQYTEQSGSSARLRCHRARHQYASHREPRDRRRRLCFKRQGSLGGEILHSKQSHQQSFWLSRFAARISTTAVRGQPGVFPRELRRTLPQPHMGTACGVHSPASICKYDKSVYSK